MKSTMLALTLILAFSALASGRRIKEEVSIENKAFAAKVYRALAKTLKPKTIQRTGAMAFQLEVKGAIVCEKALSSRYRSENSYYCTLKKGTWEELGNNVFNLGFNTKASEELFKIISVANAVTDLSESTEHAAVAQITHDRSRLTCVFPTPSGAELGLKATCQIINAL